MRRRKLLIGIGALSAGGSAAFGTEAFTSVEAERSVDVSVAGDQSAYLAVRPLSGSNASSYVSQESDGTLAVDLDGDGMSGRGGVNQDAITQVEDLFLVVNQGTQATSVYFEDDSDAVTFRVTRSTDTETAGSTGQSLEGASNSVELGVGEQVAVGLTVDTLNNDVSGSLLDTVTVYAESGAAAPTQNIPQPQYVVTSSPSSPNEFNSIQAAIDEVSSSGESGAVVGVEAGSTYTPSGQIAIDESLTLVGVDGTPTIDGTGFGGDGGAIDVTASDVTLRNFELQYSDASGGPATNGIEAGQGASGVTIDGLTVSNQGTLTGQPAISTEVVDDIEIINNSVSGGAIGVYYDSGATSGTPTISGNYIDANPGGSGSVTEGIFVYGGLANKDLEIRENRIENSGSNSRDIKVGPSSSLANSLNGQSSKQDQIESLLSENDVVSARVDDGTASDGTKHSTSAPFADLQAAIDVAISTPDGVTLVQPRDSGAYSGVTLDGQDGLLVKGVGSSRPTVSGETEILSAGASNGRPDDVTIEGLRFEGPSSGFALTAETGGSGDTHTGLTFRDNTFVASDYGVYVSNIEDSVFENNVFTVASGETAKELLVIGLRTEDARNGDNVDVVNNEFRTPGGTSLSRSNQTSGGNAIEHGAGGASEITGNNFNVTTDKGVKVLIGQYSTITKSSVESNNTGVSQSQITKN